MRDEIVSLMARLQGSTGDEQGEHTMREITADRIIALFKQFLPKDIDIESKYELNGGKIQLTIDTVKRSEKENLEQVGHIARFANDEGYNRYRKEVIKNLQSLYEV